jgi:hypothetical protein
VSPLKIKIPSKNLSRQCCTEVFNSSIERLIIESLKFGEHYSLKANELV